MTTPSSRMAIPEPIGTEAVSRAAEIARLQAIDTYPSLVGASVKPELNFVPLIPPIQIAVGSLSGPIRHTQALAGLPASTVAVALQIELGPAATAGSYVLVTRDSADTIWPVVIHTGESTASGIVAVTVANPPTVCVGIVGANTHTTILTISGYWEPL